MVRDGVTSAFELEVGTGDVAPWYAAREGGQIVNYGVSVGHIQARMKVLGDPSTALMPAGIGGSGIGDAMRRSPRWRRFSARGSRRARSPLVSAARIRPVRRWRRSSGCFASRPQAARRCTFTCATASPDLTRDNQRPRRRRKHRSTSST